MERLEDLSVAETGRRLRAGSLTSEGLTRHLLKRIEALEPKLNAFITLTAERALTDARRADAELKSGKDRGPFHGVPYGLKDMYDTKGIRTTGHSKLLIDNIPSEDSFAVGKLHEGGGVLLGKLATHEFAIGGPSWDLPWPPSRNPWNTDHFTGGSSSGSAAAVAARLMRVALGTDTTSSIRGPAALCGDVGLKATYGRVSKRGVLPLSYSLDHAGPLARSVEDAAIALQVIAGYDPEDAASVDLPVPDFRADMDKGVSGLRIGRIRHFDETPAAAPEALEAITRTENLLREAGATVEDVTLPDHGLFALYRAVIAGAEGYAIHEDNLKNRPQDFGAIGYERLMAGAFLTATDLVQAFRLRRELTAAVNAQFQRYDVLICGCILEPAPRFDQYNHRASGVSTRTVPFNVSGHPAMSQPIGLSPGGMPLSLQVVARPFDEVTMIRVGRAIEQLTGWDQVPFPEL